MNQSKSMTPLLRALLVGLCVGVVCCTLLLLGAAFLFRTADIPLGAATPIAVVAAAISAFAGGWAAARTARCRGLLTGAVCGLLLYLIILLIGLAQGGIDTGYALIKLAALTAAGGIGGILGVNGKRR